MPHGIPSERKVQLGDLVTIDFGARFSGYCSDMTRTVIIGKPSERQKAIYNTVLDAQTKAIESIKPNTHCKDIDNKARSYICKQGFGKYFGHGLGHGVGLEIHETPSLSPKSDSKLLPGMVVTIEPGIYVEDYGGVRIEDMVVITKDGFENITSSKKTANILVIGGVFLISTNDLKTGTTVEIDKDVYIIIDFLHVKPGKGAAFVRTKIKNIITGQVFEKTFRAGEKLKRALIERKTMQFLYSEGHMFYFMDNQTYEQLPISKDQIGNQINYLKDNIDVMVMFYEGTPIGVELPTFVELRVKQTEPGFKGDTATGGSKPATLETGVMVQVPLFINIGDTIKVDTRTGEYLSRV